MLHSLTKAVWAAIKCIEGISGSHQEHRRIPLARSSSGCYHRSVCPPGMWCTSACPHSTCVWQRWSDCWSQCSPQAQTYTWWVLVSSHSRQRSHPALWCGAQACSSDSTHCHSTLTWCSFLQVANITVNFKMHCRSRWFTALQRVKYSTVVAPWTMPTVEHRLVPLANDSC